jgi:hypothetical protein
LAGVLRMAWKLRIEKNAKGRKYASGVPGRKSQKTGRKRL